MVTLKDIADLTGYSISTVSRAFSNKGRVSEDTKKRVRSVAEELMFKRGATAQSIDSIGWTIGIAIPARGEYFRDDPSSSVDLRSLQAALEQRSHRSVLIPCEEGDAGVARIMKAIEEEKLDGIVVSDPPADGILPSTLAANAVPYVVVNGIFRNSGFNQIDYDNYAGMKALVAELVAGGRRRILALSGPSNHLVSHNRYQGMQDALVEAGIDGPLLKLDGAFSMESGYARCASVLAERRDFDAVVAFSDYIALGAMRAAREAGLAIPKDIAVTGFDDIEFSRFSEPPLTTVRRWSEIAAPIVVETLTRLISQRPEIVRIEILLRTTLQLRQTT